MKAPLFSIITVTYNAEHTIERTLQSVAKQTCALYEHIIVDGASTDGTLDIVARYADERRVAVSKRDRGIYDAMNTGIGMAKGDYIIFLNAGDKFHSDKMLQAYADAVLDNDYPGIVYGQTELVDDEGHFVAERHLRAPEQLTLASFAEGMVVCHQAMAVLKRIVPYYNLNYRYSADYEWCILCLQHSRHNLYLPMTTIDYLCEGMTTQNRRKSLIERFKIMCQYYGVLPTVWRHVGFVPRYLRHKRKIKRAKQ